MDLLFYTLKPVLKVKPAALKRQWHILMTTPNREALPNLGS